MVDASKDEYNKPMDSDGERELADLFDIADADVEIDFADDDRIANPSKAPQLPNLMYDNLISVKKESAATYSEGLVPLAEAVLKEEIDARLKGKRALKDSDLRWTAKAMHDILLSTDRILLESVMLGNLSRDKRSNPKLKGILARIQTLPINLHSDSSGSTLYFISENDTCHLSIGSSVRLHDPANTPVQTQCCSQ